MGGIAPPFVLQVYVLGGLERSELAIRVYEHNGLLLNVHFHVKQPVTVRFLHTLSEARLIAIVEVIHRSTERKLLLWKDDLRK